MAVYPTDTYPIDSRGYKIEADDGSRVSRADSGKPRVQRVYTHEVYRITVPHFHLTSNDCKAIKAFYDNYKDKLITYTDPFDGRSFEVFMTRPPQRVETTGKFARMVVTLTGTFLE